MPNASSPTGAPAAVLKWSAPVHPAQERTKRWYFISGGIVLAVAIYSLIVGAWSVALVAVLCASMYLIIRSHRFPDSTITITERGATLDDAHRSWSEMRGFWIMVAPAYNELHLVPNAQGKRELVIQTGTQDVAQLRETLLRHIPELPEKQESLIDAFIRICKL